MFDTFGFEIHGIRKYSETVTRKDKNNKFYKKTLGSFHYPLLEKIKTYSKKVAGQYGVNDETLEPIESKSKFLSRDIFVNEVTGTIIEKKSKYITKKSSNYEITYRINYEENYISCEFSIPKFLYGNNVLMLGINPFDKNFSTFPSPDQLKLEYYFGIIENDFNLSKQFAKHIKLFFDEEFPGCLIDYNQIKFKRIDLCWNMVFQNREFKLNYREAIKNLRKKRSSLEFPVEIEEGGIWFNTSDYNFKIYDKELEFEKNDLQPLTKALKKHTEIKKDFVYTKHNLELIKDLASRIMRFEMKFTSSYVSKIFNQIIRTKKHKVSVNGVPVYTELKYYKYLRKLHNKLVSIKAHRINYSTHFKNKELNMIVKDFEFFISEKNYLNCRNYWKVEAHIYDLENTEFTPDCSMMEKLYDLVGLKYHLRSPKFDMKALKMLHDGFSQYFSKHHSIKLKLSGNIESEFAEFYSNFSNFKHYNQIRLGKYLFNEMAKRFIKLCYTFIPEQLDDFFLFKEKMTALSFENTNKKKVVRIGKENVGLINLLNIYDSWCKGIDIKKQALLFDWSKDNIRKWVYVFTKLGYGQNFQSDNIQKIKLDLEFYYYEIGQQKLNNFFK